MANWAPLVYARTSISDFKWHVKPDDFTPEIIKKVFEYVDKILPTIGDPFPIQTPIITVFYAEGHLIVGAVCMARMLEVDEKYIKDWDGRPCFLFIGFVTKDSPINLPQLVVQNFDGTIQYDLSIFKRLYEYIITNWELSSAEISLNGLKKLPYQWRDEDLQVKPRNYRDNELKYLVLNLNSNCLRVHPEKQNHRLWQAMSESITKRTNLCLNALNKHRIMQSPFQNATIINLQETEDVIKMVPKPSSVSNIVREVDSRNDNKSFNSHSVSNKTNEKFKKSKSYEEPKPDKVLSDPVHHKQKSKQAGKEKKCFWNRLRDILPSKESNSIPDRKICDTINSQVVSPPETSRKNDNEPGKPSNKGEKKRIDYKA
ncbi:MAG: hypothetical protein K6U80_13250 [Firmicutes bacterium]|nr:hypothetical protein [Bacillota bacterium]